MVPAELNVFCVSVRLLDDDDVPLVNDLPLTSDIRVKPLSELVELVSDTLPLILTV
jgi:hypothetical protein